MKKIYLLSTVLALVFSANGFAQQRIAKSNGADFNTSKSSSPITSMGVVDTITAHWDVIFPFPSVDTAVTYNDAAGGFLGGQDSYSDIAKAQKFNSTMGITAGGTINGILFWFGGKMQNAGTASFTPTVWADNAGKPGSVIGTGAAFTVGSIDTSAAAKKPIGPTTALKGIYNVTTNFSPALIMPANKTFWAGFTLTYAAGDSAGLVTSNDFKPGDAPGVTGNFPQAQNYTFEQWSDNSWNSVNDGTSNSWQSDIAFAIYPLVDFSFSSVNENSNNINSLYNYPNPANGMTMISYEIGQTANVSITVCDIAGKKLLTLNEDKQTAGSHLVKMDVSSLANGMYFYTLTSGENKMTKSLAIVK